MEYIRCALLFISLAGYVIHLQNKLQPEFAIGYAFSCIGFLMFLAGILNILVITSVIIFFGGYLCLFAVYRDGKLKNSLQTLRCFGYLFFIIAVINLAVLLHDAKFCHYDDFSHWARAASILINSNRFPNFSDLFFEFKSYPLGSASFIYYFTLITGVRTEGAILFYQGILIIGMAVGLFAFAENTVQKTLVSIVMIVLLAGNTLLTSLLVDTLLPIAAVSAIAFCVCCCNENGRSPRHLLPYILFLISVKSSGIFYAAAIIVFAVFLLRKSFFIRDLAVLAIPSAFTLLIWKKHVEYSFYDGLSSKHSITLGKLLSTFGEKTPEDIQTIVHGFAEESFSIKNPVIIILAVLIIIFFLTKKTDNRHEVRKTILFTFFSYIVYQIFLLGMYITSMPAYEAVVLAGYERYHQSIILFMSELTLIAFLQCSDKVKSRKIQLILSVFLTASLLFAVRPDFSNYKKQDITQFERNRFEGIDESSVAPGSKCLVIANNDNSIGYIIQCSTYLFEPSDVSFISEETLISEPETASGYDYIIAVDSSEKLIKFENKEYGQFSKVLRLTQ